MRPEHDIQGKYRSEAPACHRCSLPLLHDAEFCPYCERFLDERTGPRGAAGRGSGAHAERRILGVPLHTLLTAGVVVFTLATAATVVLALTT